MQDCCFSFRKKTAINAGPVKLFVSFWGLNIKLNRQIAHAFELYMSLRHVVPNLGLAAVFVSSRNAQGD